MHVLQQNISNTDIWGMYTNKEEIRLKEDINAKIQIRSLLDQDQ